MRSGRRILKYYEILLKFLRFSIRNADNLEYSEFSMITNYLQLIKDLEYSLKDHFNFNHLEEDYDFLLTAIFKDELSVYRRYINTTEKRELIRRFKFIINFNGRCFNTDYC